jgi:hypothetical protein
MSITIRKYNKADFDDWENFVKTSSNGTIFHLRTFLSYHIDRNFNDNSLIFEKNGKIIAVFPAAKNGIDESILYSHPGASFGGFIFNNISFQESNLILNNLDNYCKDNNFSKVFFVYTPNIYFHQFNETLEYSLLWNNYKVKEVYLSSIIEIKNNFSPLDYLNSRKKRYIKNYLNNNLLKIKWNNDFDEFYPILLENKRRHGIKPTHSLDELKKINLLYPSSLHLLLLYHDEVVVGGTLNIIINNKCVMMFYNMINYNYIDLQPATIQIYESIKWVAEKKMQYLDLGVSQKPKDKNPLTPHETLINFKEQLGAKSIIRKAFQKNII